MSAEATRDLLIDGRYPGTPEGVRLALSAIQSGLRPRGATDEELFAAELVVAEALNNVVEHALEGLPEPEFLLNVTGHERGIDVEIRDAGKAMPEGRPPLGRAPVVPGDNSDLPEGGFGWFIIRELARDLDYQRNGSENRLKFRLAICVP